MAWVWNNVDIDTVQRVVTNAKFIHEHETDILDLKVQLDAGVTGLKARLQAEPDGGLEALQMLFGSLNSTEEFFGAAFLVTAVLGDGIANGRTALAAVRKF